MSENKRISIRISSKLFQYIKLSSEDLGVSLNSLFNKILEAGASLDSELLEKVVIRKEKLMEHIKMAIPMELYSRLEQMAVEIGIKFSDLVKRLFQLWFFIDKSQVSEAIQEIYRQSLEESLDYAASQLQSKPEESFMEKYKKFEEEYRGMSLEETIQDMFKPNAGPMKCKFLRRDV